MIKKIKKIGILGGTFDPCHIGHLKISKEAKRKFDLEKIIWAITKKNPLKKESNLSLQKRLKISKEFTKKHKFIKVNYYEKHIRSNNTFKLINYLEKKFINKKLYFIIGADNLINFHRWKRWKEISQKCNMLVFNRYPYKSKALKSLAFKQIDKKKLKFINFKKINISSSQLRKI